MTDNAKLDAIPPETLAALKAGTMGMSKIEKEPMPITVSAVKRIRTDGDIIRLRVSQEGQTVLLTEKQALSLAQEIDRRFPTSKVKHDPPHAR